MGRPRTIFVLTISNSDGISVHQEQEPHHGAKGTTGSGVSEAGSWEVAASAGWAAAQNQGVEPAIKQQH